MATGQGQHIPVGYVRRAHGIRGDVVIRGLVADIRDKLAPGSVVFTDEDSPRSLTVAAVADSKDGFRVSFDSIDSRDEADALRGVQLTVPASQRRTLDDGEWWPEDLVGCEVVDVDDQPVGRVHEVILGVAQDRLVVIDDDGARAEIPFVDALVPEVDVSNDRIIVDLPEGLFESSKTS